MTGWVVTRYWPLYKLFHIQNLTCYKIEISVMKNVIKCSFLYMKKKRRNLLPLNIGSVSHQIILRIKQFVSLPSSSQIFLSFFYLTLMISERDLISFRFSYANLGEWLKHDSHLLSLLYCPFQFFWFYSTVLFLLNTCPTIIAPRT